MHLGVIDYGGLQCTDGHMWYVQALKNILFAIFVLLIERDIRKYL